jgi:2-polyprenyl-6-methoxyphenol hydroxylase-like FAD-dependent oxidoreductase
MDQKTIKPTAAEVVVMGAGIVGVHNAIQCAKRGFKVVLIDDIAGHALSYKVGESLLVFSNMFLRTISELDSYNSQAFPKDGVWFTYGMEGATSFDGKAEWALQSVIPQSMRDAFVNPRLLRALVDDVQIVRPEAETLMHETARAHPNITFIDTARVKDAVIKQDGTEHEVTWKCPTTEETGSIRTKWIIDCSGRNRFLAKRMGHAVENIECNDGFRNSAIWAQFENVPDGLFGEPWTHHFSDGSKAKRNHDTLHLWGDGYWIWVIPLSQDRISIGISYDHRTELPGKNYKEKFWNIIRRYPLFDGVLLEENILEFNVFKNCQHMTDTFVSANRYGMVGDAASVIDAYYSQGVSLALVTSWHITNIIERDLREDNLDREYIDRVNIHTRMDWHIMRNLIKAKYTRAIRDSRFFLLSHLLDMVTFVGIAFPRYQLARWLVDTGGDTANEKPAHRLMRLNLMKTLFYSRRRLINPVRVQKFQRYFQDKLVERALWRLDHGVVVPNLRCIVRTPAGMIRFWKLLSTGAKSFLDISPAPMAEPPKWLHLTGEETKPRVLKFAGPLMTIIFVLLYFFDWATTAAARVRVSLSRARKTSGQKEPIVSSVSSEASAT